MAETPALSKEAFLQMAAQLGIDTSDADHMDDVYQQVLNIKKVTAELRQLDLGETEPSHTFSPGRG
jgi:hypothetical protein